MSRRRAFKGAYRFRALYQPYADNPTRGRVGDKMMYALRGVSYTPLKSLDEAKRHDDGYVILEGDWGGQIYVVAPARLVRCSRETLLDLLKVLDGMAWGAGKGTSLYFVRLEKGQRVIGGMGGGLALDAIWIHDEFQRIGASIVDVIEGRARGLTP